MKEVVIIGGGASGMMAAIVAARRGCEVYLVERLNRVGKKILVTGNGRCNMSNTYLEAKHYHSSEAIEVEQVINRFGYKETEAFFKELGIMPLVEGSKVYPLSEQATSILDVLRMEMERLKVKVLVEMKIVMMTPIEKGWQLQSEDGTVLLAHQVIVATGGMTNNSLGCDGLGYQLLKKVGHTLNQPFPILVHVLSSSPYCKMMKGTKVKAKTSVYVGGKLKRQEYGEVLFTEDGLSGPPIFQISRQVSQATLQKQEVRVTLDLFPEISKEDLMTLLYERIAAHPERQIEDLLIGMLHKRVIMPVLKVSEITAIHRQVDTLEYEEIQRLVETLKGFSFKTEGTRGYKFAQVTAGGISPREIDFKTMASKKADHLYITGEVMDVDGDCGGYNLQWAWATGYIAGQSVSRSVEKND